MNYKEKVTTAVSSYLRGVKGLPEAVIDITSAGTVTRVNYIDGNPENRFTFRIIVGDSVVSLGKKLTRKTAESAFDLALVLYTVAQQQNSQSPGEVQGWFKGELCTTRHHMDGIRNRLEELKKTYPTLFS